MAGRIIVAVLLVASGWTDPLLGQRPRLGLGAGAGVVLGAELREHGVAVLVDGETMELVQTIDMTDAGIVGAQAEWYVTRRIAVRAHAARGRGTLHVVTSHGGSETLDLAPYETGFGTVNISALDLGVSVWPWPPRSIGFAPFLSAGFGQFRYSFDNAGDSAFFHPARTRSRRAIVLGGGADMHVWRSIMLRAEAMNHRVDGPIIDGDFAVRPTAGQTGRRDSTISNIRLVIGAHVYLPFSDSDGIPD